MDKRSVDTMLEQELARVTAPAGLWDRVQLPRVERRASHASRRLTWALAAAGLVLAVTGIRTSRPPMDFRSGSASEIQAWVKSNSGLDLGLPAKPGTSVQLLGAHLVRGADPLVEVAYRTGNHDVLLRVSRSGTVPSEPHGDRTASSWVMHGQRYTLACASPEELQAACLLCHS